MAALGFARLEPPLRLLSPFASHRLVGLRIFLQFSRETKNPFLAALPHRYWLASVEILLVVLAVPNLPGLPVAAARSLGPALLFVGRASRLVVSKRLELAACPTLLTILALLRVDSDSCWTASPVPLSVLLNSLSHGLFDSDLPVAAG